MKLRLFALPLLLAFAPVLPATPHGISPAFNPDDWFDARVHDVTREDVLHLTLAGFDVQSVDGRDADLYLTAKRMQELVALGYDVERLPRVGGAGARVGYHTHATLTSELQALAAAHPGICELHDIGSSVQGRELWMMKISDNVAVEEDEPEFKYISTMHGDEVVGQELCMLLIEQLLTDYGTDPQITALVDGLEIWILPNMNPDGTAASSRYNAQGKDLNREFPDRVTDPVNTVTGRPTEVRHVMNWGFAHSPVMSANFHGGALVVNYIYDSDPNPYTSYSASPDDDVHIAHSLVYSSLNSPMYNSWSFPQGITNGAAWYVIYGGMQDWNYVWQGCNDATIELDNSKWPPYSQIPGLWSDNQASMLAYMELALTGIRGLVTDAITGAPVAASIRAFGRAHDVYTDPDVGDYHRLLLPGTYKLRYESPGYVTQFVDNIAVSAGPATRVDVALMPTSFVPPVPDIKINGGDGPLANPFLSPVTLTVELDPGDLQGTAHDWWVFGTNGTVTYWWSWPALWLPSQAPSHQGNLVTLPTFTVTTGRVPVGGWTFTFAVDAPDGVYQGTYVDTIDLVSY